MIANAQPTTPVKPAPNAPGMLGQQFAAIVGLPYRNPQPERVK